MQRHVGATLNVGDALAGVIQRFAIDRDAHRVQRQRIFWFDFAGEAGNLQAVVIIQYRQFIVNHLDLDPRRAGLDETGVDDIGGLHVTAALELGLCVLEAKFGLDGGHGAPGTRRRQPDVVAVDHGGAAVEAFVAGVADEAQSYVRLVADIGQGIAQAIRIPGFDHRLAGLEQDRADAAGRRHVHARDGLGTGGLRAELRFIAQFLQRIVMPELHLDAPVHGAPAIAVVGGDRIGSALAVDNHRRGRQLQDILHRQRGAPGARPGQAEVTAVNTFLAPAERGIVGKTDKLHGHILLAGQIRQRLADLLVELRRNAHGLVVDMQRGDQVADARALRMAFLVAQLAHRLHPADLDAVGLPGNDHFLLDQLLAHLVVPHLDFDAPVLRAPRFAGIARHRSRLAQAFIGNRFRRQTQPLLEIFRHRPGALARQRLVVTVGLADRALQGQVVGMPDEVQTDIGAVLHAPQDVAQPRKIVLRYACLAGAETNRRHDILELDGLHVPGRQFAHFQDVAGFCIRALAAQPLGARRIGAGMLLGGRSGSRRPGLLGAQRCRCQAGEQQERGPDCPRNKQRAALQWPKASHWPTRGAQAARRAANRFRSRWSAHSSSWPASTVRPLRA